MLSSASLGQLSGLAVEIFDQHDGISVLVIDELVRDLLGQHDAEPTWPKAHLGAQLGMPERIVRRIIHSGVSQVAYRETGTVIAHIEQNHAIGSDERDVDAAIGF